MPLPANCFYLRAWTRKAPVTAFLSIAVYCRTGLHFVLRTAERVGRDTPGRSGSVFGPEVVRFFQLGGREGVVLHLRCEGRHTFLAND